MGNETPQGSSLFPAVVEPSLLYAFDDDYWQYYIPGRDPEDLEQIDELDALMWEPVWMRPVSVASLDEYERGDLEPLQRDEKGRFKTAYAWLVCSENDAGARPWMGVRYKP